MDPKQARWTIYKEQMDQCGYGDALWEPAPIYSYKRIRLGDVGYIRRGRFHLLFSAGHSLGSHRLGTDVPLTFEPLDIGPIISNETRLPGYLCAGTVRKTGADLRNSDRTPFLKPGLNISFQLTGEQGAVLVTKYETCQEDIERESAFEEYTKRHYDSWVNFARDKQHGNDVKPVLVTGVDMTRDFAMMAYSKNDARRLHNFTTEDPLLASAPAPVWGIWHTQGQGPVHTNCGPRTRNPPSFPDASGIGPPDGTQADTTPKEHDQCVFVRYYTMRRRVLMAPKIIKAGAGPQDFGSGNNHDEVLQELMVQLGSDSDPGSSGGDSTTNDSGPATSYDSELELFHNVPSEEEDTFDVIARYVFRNPKAEAVLIHHRDIAKLRNGARRTDMMELLSERRPTVVVDDVGVGKLVYRDGWQVAITLSRTINFSPFVAVRHLLSEPLTRPTRVAVSSMDTHLTPERPHESMDNSNRVGSSANTSHSRMRFPAPHKHIAKYEGTRDTHQDSTHLVTRASSSMSAPRASVFSRLRELIVKYDLVSKWKRLERLDPTSREHFLLLTSILDDQTDRRATTSLQGENAAVVLDILARILDRGGDQARISHRIIGVLRSLAYNACQVPNRYKIDRNLDFDVDAVAFASGGFADVRRGRLGGELVAVKVMRVASSSNARQIQKDFCKETVLWKNISHPNILRLIAVEINSSAGKCSMISELMVNGNISHFIRSNRANRLALLADAAEGLWYLHDKKIIHGDVKGTNILITNGTPQRACLSDFGFSSPAPTTSFAMSTHGMNPGGGTPPYMAPELIFPPKFGLDRVRLSKEADIYAFGMVVYEIVTGVRPFGIENLRAEVAMWDATDGRRPMKPVNAGDIGFGQGVWELVEECWSGDRTRRPTAGDVRRHLSAVAPRSPIVHAGPVVEVGATLEVSTDSMASGTNFELFNDPYQPTTPTDLDGGDNQDGGGGGDRQDTRSINERSMLERSISVTRQVVSDIHASIPPAVRGRFEMFDRRGLRGIVDNFGARFGFPHTPRQRED